MIDPGLCGKVAPVTGANNSIGIGAAVARAFAQQGAAVFLTYFRTALERTPDAPASTDPSRAYYRSLQSAPIEPVIQSNCDAGGRAKAWAANLAHAEAIAELFDRSEAALPGFLPRSVRPHPATG